MQGLLNKVARRKTRGGALAMDEHDRTADPDQAAELVQTFFKTFIDPARLRLAARLLSGPATLEALAAELKLDGRSVVRHLNRLGALGLLTVVEKEGTRFFGFDEEGLRGLAASVLRTQEARQPADERGKTLASFLRAGRLVRIPAQRTKQLYVLAEIARRFQPGQIYTEREVNAALKELYAEDHVTLRRLLVDFGFLKRYSASGGAVYTKESSPEAVLAEHSIAVQ
jgi:hypothetical protein